MEGRHKNIKEGELNEVPEFYKSMSNSVSINRLRSLDIKLDIPYIVEYIYGTNYLETFEVPFKTRFKNIPLVVGLYDTSELGVDKVRMILPNNQNLTVTTEGVTIGTASAPAKIGGRYKLRVYNLDLV